MVEADTSAALGGRLRPNPEEPEIVVVRGTRQTQKGRIGARFTRHYGHTEHLGVEALGTVEVGDKEDGMVQPDRADRRHCSPVGPTSFQPLSHVQPWVALSLMLRNAISSRDRAIRRLPASIAR